MPPRPAINQIHVLGSSLARKSVLLALLPCLQDVSWPASPTPGDTPCRCCEFAGEVGWGAGEEGWDPELVSTGVPWDGAALLGDFAPIKGTAANHGAPLLQHKHTHTGRSDDIMTWLCASYLGGLIIIIIIFLSRSSASEQCPSRQGCGSHHCVGLPCLRKGEILITPGLTKRVSSCRMKKASEHLAGSLGWWRQPAGALHAPTPDPCTGGRPWVLV